MVYPLITRVFSSLLFELMWYDLTFELNISMTFVVYKHVNFYQMDDNNLLIVIKEDLYVK